MDEKQILFSPEIAHRLAAIDIGTNSMRLMVAEPLRGGNYRILDEERESTRLGRESKLHRASSLRRPSNNRSPRCAGSSRSPRAFRLTNCEPSPPAPSAKRPTAPSSAAGPTKNWASISTSSAPSAKPGWPFPASQRAFDLTDKNVVVADIGGGSTEIVLASGNLIEAIYTTPLGAVRLTEMYGNGGAAVDGQYEKLVKAIDHQLRKLDRSPVSPRTC